MKITCQSVFAAAIVVMGVAAVWIAAYSFNEGILAITAYSDRANWIFLPASIRLIAVLLFDEVGAVGLALGAFVTAWFGMAHDWPYCFGLAVSSAIAPMIAVAGCRQFVASGRDLAGLRPIGIAILSIACAGANALLLNGYLGAIGRLQSNFSQVAIVLVGDTLGTAIVLFILSGLLTFSLPKRR